MTTTADLARNTAFVATYADEITVRKGDIIALAVAYEEFLTAARSIAHEPVGSAARANRLATTKKFAAYLDALQKKTGVTLTDRVLADYL